MKRSIIAFLLFAMTCTCFAQTQQGIVKTRGRMVNGQLVPGTRLPDAIITLNIGNSLKSGKQGTFSFNVPNGKTYSLVTAQKQGYTLADPEYTHRTFVYSATVPFYVVLEDENQRLADINAATRKVRNTLYQQLEKREQELQELRAKNQLSEKEYQQKLKELNDNQSKSEQLVREMAERYASTDYDQLDDYNRQVQMYIEEGELQKADSMIRSKGDMEKRVAEYHRVVSANQKVRAELEQSEAGATKTYEDLSQDLYRRHEIFLQNYKWDSALYCLKTRADLDTTNIQPIWEYANLCQKQKRFSDCEKYFHICLREFVRHHDTSNIAKTQHDIGTMYKEIHDYKRSEYYLELALENKEKLFRENPDVYRSTLSVTQNNLGNLYYDLRDYANSEKFYKLALQNKELSFMGDSNVYRADLAMTQNNLGALYYDLRDYANSENYLKQALENREKLFGYNPDAYRADLANVHVNLGTLYHKLRDYTNSEVYYKLALANREQLFKENPDAYRVSLTDVQNSLGILYYSLHDYSKAEKYLKFALENIEYLFNGSSDAYRSDLASIQSNLGSLYHTIHDYANSEKYYRLAFENTEVLFKDNPDAYRESLADSQDNLGVLYSQLRDYVNSEKYFKLSLDNKEQLFKTNSKAYRATLALAQCNLGTLYSKSQDYANSEKYYKLALDNYEILFNDYPNVYCKNLADVQTYLGILYCDLLDYTNSEKYYKLALQNKEQLYKNNPNRYCKTLADHYWNIMVMYKRTDDLEKYEEYLLKTLELYKILYSLSPTDYLEDVVDLQNRTIIRMLAKGNLTEALALAKETYAMDKSNEQSKRYLARCYNSEAYSFAEKKRYKDALESIDQAVSLAPTSADFYDSKGEILLMQGNNQDALKMWKKVLELNPEFLKDFPNGTGLSNGLKKLGLIE